MDRKRFLRHSLTLSAALPLTVPTLLSAASGRTAPIRPPALRPADTVGLVAPAGIVYDPEEFDRMEQVLRSMGLKVRFGRHVRRRHGYLAGRDGKRVEDLNRFFADTSVNAIMAVRGGWGSNRILPRIDFRTIRRQPKIFCGFSDITSIHLAINRLCNLVTFHGPNGTSDWTPFTRNAFRSMMFGEFDVPGEYPVPANSEVTTLVPGMAEGIVIGGNLTLFTSLIGTRYMPDPEGTVLILEDIGEEIYRIDRMFSQLKHAGILNRINGLVFGRCTDCGAGDRPSLTLEEVLKGYLEPLGIPAFYGAPISHEPDNLTIPLGVFAKMHAGSGRLKLLEPAVRLV